MGIAAHRTNTGLAVKPSVTAVLACLVVVLAMVALTLFERRRHDSEMEDLRRRVAALAVATSEQSTGGSTQYGSHQPVLMPPPSRAMAEPGRQLTAPTASATAPSIPAAEMRDDYEIMFGSDHTDSSWTGADLRQANAKIGAALPEGSQLLSLECRASMCRIETSHKDMEHYHAFVRAAFMTPETEIWNSGTISTPLRDDTAPGEPLVMVSYVGREGHDLPPAQ